MVDPGSGHKCVVCGAALLWGEPSICTSCQSVFDGKFVQTQQGGQHHGNHRQAGAQIHGSPGAVSGPDRARPITATQALSLKNAGAFPPRAVVTDPSSDPRTVQDTGIEVGEVTAYRAWRVRRGTLVLESMLAGTAWWPGKAMEGDPENPRRGVHAFKTLDHVWWQYGRMPDANWSCYQPPIAYGSVKLWGTIYEHALGYRAQFGIPYEILGVIAPGATVERDLCLDEIVWHHAGEAGQLFDRVRALYNHAGMLPEPPPSPEAPELPPL